MTQDSDNGMARRSMTMNGTYDKESAQVGHMAFAYDC